MFTTETQTQSNFWRWRPSFILLSQIGAGVQTHPIACIKHVQVFHASIVTHTHTHTPEIKTEYKSTNISKTPEN